MVQIFNLPCRFVEILFLKGNLYSTFHLFNGSDFHLALIYHSFSLLEIFSSQIILCRLAGWRMPSYHWDNFSLNRPIFALLFWKLYWQHRQSFVRLFLASYSWNLLVFWCSRLVFSLNFSEEALVKFTFCFD